MTTMLFAILEIDSGTLRFVNAGHPPPLIVEGAGATRVFEGAGPPLGVMDTWRYEERVATLAPGMTALLYTDGLTLLDSLKAVIPNCIDVHWSEMGMQGNNFINVDVRYRY
jgi:serine phosphatase RsbU (regulator of sigma subunit)